MISLFQEDLKKSMKKKDKVAIRGLRNIIGKLKAKKIDKCSELTHQECLLVLKGSVKQIKDSIQQYKAAGRNDLAESEILELQLLEQYLPKAMSKKEVKKIVTQIIKKTGADSIKDLGKIMGIIMKFLSTLILM